MDPMIITDEQVSKLNDHFGYGLHLDREFLAPLYLNAFASSEDEDRYDPDIMTEEAMRRVQLACEMIFYGEIESKP